MLKTQTARFAPGQVVRHSKFGYRGLIFDVDASFSQSPEWYEVMSEMHPSKDRPWYHILVDGEKHTTYVAEESLIACPETEEFDHPLLEHLFKCSDSGDISSRLIVN
ncbi:heat shock protein HspQ [Kordiimonas pumila]|uniref:Heat shock protein HspQ n=1 Tax=Kordiimonas pumila TaxID=2161677 RepID=A0ABV7D2V2_9PROT|nr:heat shock protein HspQ [Kordiimonas pumila]